LEVFAKEMAICHTFQGCFIDPPLSQLFFHLRNIDLSTFISSIIIATTVNLFRSNNVLNLKLACLLYFFFIETLKNALRIRRNNRFLRQFILYLFFLNLFQQRWRIILLLSYYILIGLLYTLLRTRNTSSLRCPDLRNRPFYANLLLHWNSESSQYVPSENFSWLDSQS
jgi:hypothetical protein